MEPTKLVFAIVIAESLREYSVVLTSPFRHHHYVAALALIGVYLTTVWSWRGWHSAHVLAPYKVEDGVLAPSEVYRFYADLAIVIAYAYTLFQVEPILKDPRHDAVWLLAGYPLIVSLYIVENRMRIRAYGPAARRTIPLVVTLFAHVVVAAAYLVARHYLDDNRTGLLILNCVTFAAALVVMWRYRHFNDYYKAKYVWS